ncbi:MAG: FG-GAP-like repeat-containing protein [Cytophagales bacterium]|nr:FG-GAP-like repeat-containing protein [Cytophagales bacterium]
MRKILSSLLTFTFFFLNAQDTLYQKHKVSVPGSGSQFARHFYTGDFNGDGLTDLIIGERLQGPNNNGYVHFYHGTTTGFIWEDDIRFSEEESSYGQSVAAGDINNYGYDDIIVGAPRSDNGSPDNNKDYGALFIYLGSSSGIDDFKPHFRKNGHQDVQFLGVSSIFVENLNGDGYGDFVTTAPREDIIFNETGAIDIWFGSATGYSGTNTKIAGSIGGDWQGLWLANAGDINSDGFDDIISGGIKSVKVFLGGSGLIGTSTFHEISNIHSSGNAQVMGSGDVNGDGFDDISYQDPSNRLHVLYGDSSSLNSSPNWSLQDVPNSEYPWNGISSLLGKIGDWNRDGFDDLLVGNLDKYAYVINGGPNGLENEISLVLSNTNNHNFSQVSHQIGDNDDNGEFEIAIAATNHNSLYTFEFPEQRIILSDWQNEGNQGGGEMGFYISGAGDVNGDNIDDFLIGSHLYDESYTNNGRVSFFLGSDSGPLPLPTWVNEFDQTDSPDKDSF